MKSVTLLLMEQPHTPQFRGSAMKQGHLCPIESRGQLPAFLHTLRLSRSRLCHLRTQLCGLNTGVRKERSVKMKITVKHRRQAMGTHRRKEEGPAKVKIFRRPSCFRANLSQRRSCRELHQALHLRAPGCSCTEGTLFTWSTLR